MSFMVSASPMSRRSWMVGSVTFSCHSRRIFSASARRSTWAGLSLTVSCRAVMPL